MYTFDTLQISKYRISLVNKVFQHKRIQQYINAPKTNIFYDGDNMYVTHPMYYFSRIYLAITFNI